MPRLGAQLYQFEQVQPRHYVQPFVLRGVAERDKGAVQRVLGQCLQLGPMDAQVVQQHAHRLRIVGAHRHRGRHILGQLDQFIDCNTQLEKIKQIPSIMIVHTHEHTCVVVDTDDDFIHANMK